MPHIGEVEPGCGEKFGAGKALDVGYLEEVVSRLVEASVAPSTRKTYLSGHLSVGHMSCEDLSVL